MRKARGGDTVFTTRSPCPVCRSVLEARVVEKHRDLYMIKDCPEHGRFELFYWRDADFFRRMAGAVNDAAETPASGCERGDFSKLRGICLDFTQRCNLFCANCFANANVDMPGDKPLGWYKEKLSAIKGAKPVVFVQGGEPTLRDDLNEFIEFLIGEGFVVKLVTNGIRLVEDGYVERLKKTGLEWVFLQFDGFSSATSVEFRGKDLISLKMDVLKKLSDNGFRILLAVMLEKEWNDREVGRILDLAFRTPGVQQVSLLPGSRIGRNRITGVEEQSTAVDVMDWLGRDTSGAIGRKDFLAFQRIAGFLYRTTRNPDFRPRTCFFSMLVYHKGKTVIPLNRLLNPFYAASHPAAVLAAIRMLARLNDLDNAPYRPDILYITLEKFRSVDTIDLCDAETCVKVHLSPDGEYIPSCIFNVMHRPQTMEKNARDGSATGCQ